MRGKRLFLAVILLILCAAMVATVSRASRTASSCPDYYIIDSRGSGAHAEQASEPGTVFTQELRQKLPDAWIQTNDNPYPAVSIMPTLDDILSLVSVVKLKAIQDALNGVGALFSQKNIGAYHASVVNGENKLRSLIKQRESGSCSATTKLVLVGYSQGAQVTGNVYQLLSVSARQRIAGVVLFGDPRYNHKSFADKYARDNNGVLPVRGEFPADSRGKVASYCHAKDPVCQGLGQFLLHGESAHENYNKLGEPQKAADALIKNEGTQPAPRPTAPARAMTMTFGYTSYAKKSYRISVSVKKPSFQLIPQADGSTFVTGGDGWGNISVANPTSRSEPLGGEAGDTVSVDAFVSMPPRLDNAWTFGMGCQSGQEHEGECGQPPAHLELQAQRNLDYGNFPDSISPGQNLTLPAEVYRSNPRSPIIGLSWMVPDGLVSAWVNTLVEQPAYYVVTVSGSAFGNAGVDGALDDETQLFDCYYGDYIVSTGVIAMFDENGKPLNLEGDGCTKALDLINSQYLR